MARRCPAIDLGDGADYPGVDAGRANLDASSSPGSPGARKEKRGNNYFPGNSGHPKAAASWLAF
jgi:hypothetical protein